MPAHSRPRRGEVWMVSLDPTVGHEIKKTRPAIVVTNDVYNTHNWVVVVVPITSHNHAEYDQVLIVPPEVGLRSRASRSQISFEPSIAAVAFSGSARANPRQRFMSHRPLKHSVL